MSEPTLWSGCPPDVPARLSEEARAVDGAFTDATDALLNGRDNLMRLTETLARYCQGLDDFRGMEIPATVSRLADRLVQVESVNEGEFRAIGQIRDFLSGTAAPLAELSDLVRTLETFASTSRVVEAESDLAGNMVFSAQIKHLSSQSQEGYADLLRHKINLADQVASMSAGQEGFARASLGHLEELRADLTRQSQAVGPAIGQAVRAASQVSVRVDDLSAQMTTAIGSMQVGDSFRQRLEHVALALGCARDDGAAARLVRLIGARQLNAAAAALDRDVGRLAQTLATVSGRADRLVAMAESLTLDRELANILRDLRSLCGAGLAALYSAQSQRRMVDRQMRGLSAVVGKMRKVVESQAGVDEDMRLGSYNVALRSRRSARNAAAMNYVARQIEELVGDCLAARSLIVTSLREIDETINRTISDNGGVVRYELDAVADGLGVLNAMLGFWRNLRYGLEKLVAEGPLAGTAFAACARQMDQQRETAKRIRAMADELSRQVSKADLPVLLADPDACAAALAMRQLYSVPEEREIHDTLCPPAAAAGPPPLAAAVGAAVGAAIGADDDIDWF
ncbi:MAG: hypothetical protein KDK24_07465 [Pseudooceanicola sp.]|nr:hypothetical protein [Pseudooceanicola sp.]